ncbi:MAG: lipopolysaccharide kinase InaA family protein [Porphyromonas sp.]|nr:lipopolysaccharide kinase InaA family protein [Porphyromonas sp.]
MKEQRHTCRSKRVFFPDYPDMGKQLGRMEPLRHGYILYDERNKLVEYSFSNILSDKVLVKYFKRTGFIRGLFYAFFGKSKAERSYLNSVHLNKLGISAPTPYGYIEEYRCGTLYRSLFACKMLSGYETVRALAAGEITDDEALFEALVDFICTLHRKGIHNKDLSPGNILYKADERGEIHFALVDVNRMEFRPLTSEERWKNMGKLCYPITMSRRLATAYAKEMGEEENEVVHYMIREGDRFFASKCFKTIFREEKRRGNALSGFFRVLTIVISRKIRNFRRGGMWEKFFLLEKKLMKSYYYDMDYRHNLKQEYIQHET